MTILFAVLGALIGGAVAEWPGIVAGIFIGGLCGEVLALRERLRKLERTQAAASASTMPKEVRREQVLATQVAAPVTAGPTVAESAPVKLTPPTPHRTQNEPPAASVARAAAAKPSAAELHDIPWVRWVRDFFTGGNAVVRISIIVLFFGVAFLLQYAAEHNRLPIELRLFGAAALAIVFLVIGWRLRKQRSGFALALQGGATGVLYLVIFASLRLYAVLDPIFAFALLLVIVVLSAALAVLQNSIWLAVLSISGGFLAPILTSSGGGKYVVLFSFYAVLNLGILGIAWYKSWRALNVLGFLFTFVIGAAWGVLRYQPEFFATTEPFLILFFVFYVAIAVLFAARQPPELKGYVDGTLVFGVPVTAFALQSAMLKEQPYVLSASAFAVAALYLGIATTLWRRSAATRAHWRLLVEAFVALSITFATLAIPLALNGRWSAATWALEGAALIWVGCRQSRRLPRVAGALLQCAAACMLWRDADRLFDGWPLFNSTFLGAGLVAAAGVFSSHLLYRYVDRLHTFERPFAAIAFWWGWFWWLAVGLTQIDHSVIAYELRVALVFVALSCVAASVVHARLAIPTARWAALSLLPTLALFAAIDAIDAAHPAARYGWIAWPAAWLIWYVLLKRHEGEPQRAVARSAHTGSYWLLTALVAWEAGWLLDYSISGADVWRVIAWALIPVALLSAANWRARALPWPFALHSEVYVRIADAGLAAYLVLWSLTVGLSNNADAHPLSYLPVFNPLDIAQVFVLLSLLRWWRRAQSLTSAQAWTLLGALTFLWLNAVLLRTMHHWTDVPYDLSYLWRSTAVQAALSILWTVLALGLVWVAARRSWRVVWFAGAGLLAVELLKLFFVDLSNSGSVARIVSFMGVGVLGVLIGYVSPLPPQPESK